MGRLALLWWLSLSLSLSLLLGCASLPTVKPPPVRKNLELEILRQGADQPNAQPLTLLALYGTYVAGQRDAEAWRYFQARAKAQPEQPLFLALEGVFQARLANEIGLFNRVAWVNDGVAKLDRAVEKDPVFARYLRALVLAELPEEHFHSAQRAVSELQWAYERRHELPYGLRRPIYRGLAFANLSLGRAEEAKQALAQSGYSSLDLSLPQFTTDTWFTQKAGVRFGEPKLSRCAPGVFCAQGFGFSDFYFVETSAGLVAVDAGFSARDMNAALVELRKLTPAPVVQVLLTHAHYDHVGGLPPLVSGGAKVVAHARWAESVRLQRETGNPWRSFFAPDGPPALDLKPDQLVTQRTALSVGGVDFVIHPLAGGETEDTLIIELPKAGLVFSGDAIMPYVGAPFFPEGSADGLLSSIALLRQLKPTRVLSGHTAMTERWPIEAMEGLEAALVQTRQRTVAALQAGKPLTSILEEDTFPAVLAQHPSAVIPFVATRTHFIQRLAHARSGYWQAGQVGLEPLSDAELGAAFDAVGGGSASALARAARRLLAEGDFVLALKVADGGLARHAGHAELQAARKTALDRLRMHSEQVNPFKLIIYGELAGAELPAIP